MTSADDPFDTSIPKNPSRLFCPQPRSSFMGVPFFCFAGRHHCAHATWRDNHRLTFHELDLLLWEDMEAALADRDDDVGRPAEILDATVERWLAPCRRETWIYGDVDLEHFPCDPVRVGDESDHQLTAVWLPFGAEHRIEDPLAMKGAADVRPLVLD